MNILNWFLIGAGGAIGSVCRYETQQFIQSRFAQPWPVGTGAVNVLGCFGAGLLLGLLARHPGSGPVDWRLLGLTGFCGGFTTFSAFALETMSLLRGGQTWLALCYIGGSLGLGLLAVALGAGLTR